MSQVVELASEAEGFAEHGGLPPAAGGASRHITASAMTQNLELDPLAAGVHQPVLADAGFPIQLAQDFGILLDRTVADDFQHHVGRTFEFNVAVFLAFDQLDTTTPHAGVRDKRAIGIA